MNTVVFDPQKLDRYLTGLHEKFLSLEERISSPQVISAPAQLKKLSQEIARLKPLAERHRTLGRLTRQIQEAEAILSSEDDKEMKTLAREEIDHLSEEMETIRSEVLRLLAADSVEDDRNVFLEIRAGAGGNEASLFASDLLRMYTRFAEKSGWKSEVISTTYSGIGGIKEIILYVKGPSVHRYLRHESGVHRVQRVPVTEASGRIHTSTVTVAVMPEVEDVEVGIQAKDLRIDTYAASGPGGQHVNRTHSAIRITHIPSGVVVTCQDEKSQHKNKDKALRVLKARLYEMEMSQKQDDLASQRKSQVGSGERSEKIRTYNFPQNRVTDHRIHGRNFNLETTLDGTLDDLLELLIDVFTQRTLEDKLKQIIS